MKKFLNYIKEQKAYLGDRRYGFSTDKYGTESSVSALNVKIYNYIKSIYGPFGFVKGEDDKDIIVDGDIINTEYISKMVNNYTVFKIFITMNKITDEEEFYNELENSFYDMYHYNGKFFKKITLPTIIKTSRKGNLGEKKSLSKFKEVASKKGMNIDIQTPTLKEDISGIDAKFNINGKTYTIQVKPFVSNGIKGSNYYAKSNGSLSLGVDYLVLYKNNDYIILKNPKKYPIRIQKDYFVYLKSNILFTSV